MYLQKLEMVLEKEDKCRSCFQDTLNAPIENYMRKQSQWYIFFLIDFQKAFDASNHIILWQTILRTGVQVRMLNIKKNHCTRTYKLGSQKACTMYMPISTVFRVSGKAVWQAQFCSQFRMMKLQSIISRRVDMGLYCRITRLS